MRRRKRNHKRMVGNMSIIYISSILALSFMGVGYAAWNDGLNMDIGITTGFIDPEFYLDHYIITYDKGELNLSYSEEDRTLKINGWIYPDFDDDVFVRIANNGSIPVKLLSSEPVVKDVIITRFDSPIEIKNDDVEELIIHILSDHDTITAENNQSVDELIGLISTAEKQADIRTFEYKLIYEQGVK